MEERTLSWQLDRLRSLVDSAFVKTAREVKGAFTTGDYVTWLLNDIFGPQNWSFTILQGPDVVNLNEKSAYAQVVGRLEVTFADGSTAHQDDIGIWPLMATGHRGGGTLEDTAPERYETTCKAARTDCLKNATYNLGTCFAPLSDGVLVKWLEQSEARKRVAASEGGKSAEEHKTDLFGDVEDEIVRRQAAANAARRAGGNGRTPAGFRPQFLNQHGLTEKEALSALGPGIGHVDDWLEANDGKVLADAEAEILAVSGQA